MNIFLILTFLENLIEKFFFLKLKNIKSKFFERKIKHRKIEKRKRKTRENTCLRPAHQESRTWARWYNACLRAITRSSRCSPLQGGARIHFAHRNVLLGRSGKGFFSVFSSFYFLFFLFLFSFYEIRTILNFKSRS
jgi:hypothetical protein